MNEFKTYHPIVNFVYFAFVIAFTCIFTHPAALAISLICAFAYSAILHGSEKTKKNLAYMLPLMIVTAVTNPMFNHEGMTIIAYFPNGNPFTLESAAYGVGAAVMLISVILNFSCFNAVMTSDKFIYLFGRIIPTLSLVVSMTLRFVPRFSAQLKTVANAQRCIGRDMSDGGIIKRAKCGLTILSATITWALENAVETAESMKSRGYGLSGRTAFSVFTFDKRDKAILIYILFFGIYTLVGGCGGKMHFGWFPSMCGVSPSPLVISVFAAYFLLCVCPIAIEIREAVRWRRK